MTFNVAFIGLGNMGLPIANNLLKNHVNLFVYNRTKEKMAQIINQGAQSLEWPKNAYEKCNIVFSMVSNDQALLDITTGDNGILKNAKPGCIHVSMSTISPKLARDLAEKHLEKGVQYIAAPVFGRPDRAENAQLAICYAGQPEAKMQIEPLLNFIASKYYDFGEMADTANSVKLSGNFLILNVIESLSEAFAFGKKNGVNPHDLYTFLIKTIFPSPVYEAYGKLIVNQQFSPAGFKMSLGLKDIDLLLRTADATKVPMPIAGLLHDRLMAGLANDRHDLDWSAISMTQMEESGL